MTVDTEIYHHGILGQKWGVRRFQNEDGSLTSAGKKRYRKIVSYRENIDKKSIKTKGKKAANIAIEAAKKTSTAYSIIRSGYLLSGASSPTAAMIAGDVIDITRKVTGFALSNFGTVGSIAVGSLGIVATGAAAYATVRGIKNIKKSK